MFSIIKTNQELLFSPNTIDSIKFDEQQQFKRKKTWSICKKQVLHKKIIENDTVKQLVTNPLLLTLLRLVFEETGETPVNRVGLYQEGLSILLKQWNTSHDDGDEYKQLSLKQKEDLLSYIAHKTFIQGEYFFKQQQLEQYIADYLKTLLPTTSTAALKSQSKAVLASIQTQHSIFTEWTKGIYAFSVLSFHEYLTAKAIAAISSSVKLEIALQQLVAQIADERWHQVLILVAEMLPNADYLLLLIKYEIDKFINAESVLQPFLSWLEQKSVSEQTIYKPEATRAFCIENVLDLNLEVSASIDENLAFDLSYNSFYVDEHTFNLQNCRFSAQQKQTLQQYYILNKLLLDCINQACCVTGSIREELHQNLFAPSTIILDKIAIA